MTALKRTIEKFLEKQAKVYAVDENRHVRDARVAKRSARDHSGRWFYEMFQNSDDAWATIVDVRVTQDAVYVADIRTR